MQLEMTALGDIVRRESKSVRSICERVFGRNALPQTCLGGADQLGPYGANGFSSSEPLSIARRAELLSRER